MTKKHTQKPDSHKLVEELQNQVNDLTEALKRERADSINLRRRHDEDLANLKNRVKASVVADLLPAIDNLERALKHTPADLKNNSYVKGVEAVVKQFDKSLESIGVSRIASVGQPFDPRLHEAVSMEEGSGGQEIVVEELRPGFMIGNEVVRHAMVKVTN
jgi:molecular chaperone GrpE